MIIPILQPEKVICGQACVAIILGISFDKSMHCKSIMEQSKKSTWTLDTHVGWVSL
jgi:hypothetical protein